MIVFVWTEIKICVYYRLRLQSSSCGRSLKLPIAKELPIVEKGGAIDDYYVNQTPQGVQHGVFSKLKTHYASGTKLSQASEENVTLK